MSFRDPALQFYDMRYVVGDTRIIMQAIDAGSPTGEAGPIDKILERLPDSVRLQYTKALEKHREEIRKEHPLTS